MANDNSTTTRFKVDISELKKAMQEAKRSISIANSEFKAASSAMEDWEHSTDGVSAKLKQLDSNLKSQKTILANLEQQYELTVKEMGEGSAAADRLKVSINNQKAIVNKTEREISNYEATLSEVSEAEKTAAKTGKTVAEVLNDVGENAEGASDGFTTFKGAIATFAGNALTGLANGIKNGISSIVGLADETREYRNELGKLETAFTSAGHSTETATKTYKELNSVLGDEGQAVEAANHLAKLTKNEKDLSTWTNIATGVYGTFGDSLPIEGLTEAANETSKTGAITGQLADALNWAGVSEDEFQESLDKCSGEQERQKLIMDTLNGLYSDAADKYRETNSSVIDANKAQSDYQDTLATLGEKIEPVMTAIKTGVTELLSVFLELIEDVDMEAFTAKIQEGFTVLKDEVLPAIKEGFQWILDNKDMLIAGLVGIASGFAAFKTAQLISTATAAIQKFKKAQDAATLSQALMNAVMNANPMVLIVTIVAAVIGAIVAFVATNDEARAKIKEIWDSIVNFCKVAVDAIVKFFTETIPQAIDKMVTFLKKLPEKVWTWLLNTINKVLEWRRQMIDKAIDIAKSFVQKIIDYIKELPGKIWDWLLKTINKIVEWDRNITNKAKEAASGFIDTVINFVKELPNKIWTWLVNVVQKIGQWGSNLISAGREAASGLFNSIVEKIQSLPDKMLSIGSDLVHGLWEGIGDAASWLKNKISGFVGDVTGWLKKFFKIGSPSKLMATEIGQWLPKGMAVGVDKNATSLFDSMKTLTTGAVKSARDGLSSASGSLSTGGLGGRVVNNNFTQVINSPKQLNRLDIYRQSKNLLGFVGG